METNYSSAPVKAGLLPPDRFFQEVTYVNVLGRIGLFFFNLFMIVIVIAMAAYSFLAFKAGEIGFFSFLLHLAAYFVIWRFSRSRSVQSLLGSLFGWDPFAGIANEQRRFNDWYNNVSAQNARREAERNAAAAAARARYEARDKAIWHEYQARNQAGTYSGYQHSNLAKKYREEARR